MSDVVSRHLSYEFLLERLESFVNPVDSLVLGLALLVFLVLVYALLDEYSLKVR